MSTLGQLPPDEDRGPAFVIVTWVGIGLASFFLLLRLWARQIKRSLGFDDGLMLLAHLCFLGDGVLFTVMHQNGTSRHFAYLTLEQQELQLKLLVVALDFSIPVTTLGKIAIGITILRIIGNTSKWQKWAIQLTIAITFTTSLIDWCFSTFRCGDPRILWTLSRLAVADCGVSEDAANIYNDFTNGWQILNDFLFSILPMFVVWRLNMSLRQRFALAIALGLTLVTGAAAIAKAIFKASLDTTDISWNLPTLLIWFSVEATLVISFGSIPSLTPLWKRYLNRPQQSYKSYQKGSSVRINGSKGTPHQGTAASNEPRRQSIELMPLKGGSYGMPGSAAVWPGGANRSVDDVESDQIHVPKSYEVSSGKP